VVLYSQTDISLNGNLTVNSINIGRGGGMVATNTAVGASAIGSNTTGANNTALGYQAGYAGTANTLGSNNTYIGYQAQANANNYSNSTAIGAGAVITGNNQVVLGTTTETVIIPRRIRYLDPPIRYRTTDGTQSVASGSNTLIQFQNVNSAYNPTYPTGVDYSVGVFTNNNSYAVGIQVSTTLCYSANITGVRYVYISHSVLGRMGVATTTAASTGSEPCILTTSSNFILKAGETFSVYGWQNSGASLTILYNANYTSQITFSVL
jgi:hypothetical protein